MSPSDPTETNHSNKQETNDPKAPTQHDLDVSSEDEELDFPETGVETASVAGTDIEDIEALEDSDEVGSEDETDDSLDDDDEDAIPAAKKHAPLALKPGVSACETFDDLLLEDQLVDHIQRIGWTSPTLIQKLSLPHTLSGRDAAGFAQTGTGKTGVFLITIGNYLFKNAVKPSSNIPCLVVVPTRELAVQIQEDAVKLFGDSLEFLAVFGGMDYEKQAQKIRQGCHCIIATPGRLRDYLSKRVIKLNDLKILVCDEADRMFEMGFLDDIDYIFNRTPDTAQKLLFSATPNDQIEEIAFKYLDVPEYLYANPETITPAAIEQMAYHTLSSEKLRVLIGLMRDINPTSAIIFVNTKLTAEWLHYKLSNNGFGADIITGDLPQRKRIKLIEKIKRGETKALIATDVASRGLHIPNLSHVFNFDLPDDAANYIHRIGRTARAGKQGIAISFVCEDYGPNLVDINQLLGDELQIHTQWFDPAYLDIKDQAGNPYKQADYQAPERPSRDRKMRRPQQDDGRYSQSEPRGGQRGGQRAGQRDGQRDGQQAGGRSGGRNQQRRRGRSADADSQQVSNRSHNQSHDGSRRSQKQRHGRRNQQQDGRRHQGSHSRHDAQSAASFASKQKTTAPQTESKSLWGIAKKMIKTIFSK